VQTKPGDVTRLLRAFSSGDRNALDQLLPLVYDELHTLAVRAMRGERKDQTLNTTALVHEAYLRLVDQQRVQWQERAQFFCIAAQIMRRLLVDNARRHRRIKRGGGRLPAQLGENEIPASEGSVDLLSLDENMTRLADFDANQARIVELRFFGGLTIEETAEVLGLSPATIKREWTLARAWLRRAMDPEHGSSPSSE